MILFNSLLLADSLSYTTSHHTHNFIFSVCYLKLDSSLTQLCYKHHQQALLCVKEKNVKNEELKKYFKSM
jgi:hypothetical protein